MAEPREWAERIEREASLPGGGAERFAGYAVMGVSFDSGHVLALRRWPAYDSSKAERELGLKARPLKETLHDAFEWYRSRGGARPTTDMV